MANTLRSLGCETTKGNGATSARKKVNDLANDKTVEPTWTQEPAFNVVGHCVDGYELAYEDSGALSTNTNLNFFDYHRTVNGKRYLPANLNFHDNIIWACIPADSTA